MSQHSHFHLLFWAPEAAAAHKGPLLGEESTRWALAAYSLLEDNHSRDGLAGDQVQAGLQAGLGTRRIAVDRAVERNRDLVVVVDPERTQLEGGFAVSMAAGRTGLGRRTLVLPVHDLQDTQYEREISRK